MRAAILALLLLAPAAQAQMYKCVDARGVTQYSDKPCPGSKGREVDIRGQPPISGKLAAPGSDAKAAEHEFQRRQLQRTQKEREEAQALQAQQQRCGSMHTQLDFLTRYSTISRMNEKGERVYMDDATRNARVEQLKAEIARNCR